MQAMLTRRATASQASIRPSAARPSKAVSVRAVAAPEAPSKKRPSPLEKGGTLSGADAAGKDAGDAAKAALGLAGPANMRIEDGIFKDKRWINGEGKGRWDLEMFPKTSKGEPDWDLVIDAEIARRKMLEATPIASRNEDPVNFDTSEIPAWAWIKRFHLPEAEKLNGRAAMMGYVIAGAVDLMGGSGLVDQQESFFGKLALHVVVFAILIVRSTSDLDKYKGLLDEATFYDKQWNSTWEGTTRPSETQQ